MGARAKLADLAALVLLADVARQSTGADLEEIELERPFWGLRRHLADAAQLLVSIGAGGTRRGAFQARRDALRKPGLYLGRLAKWLEPDRPGPHLRALAEASGGRTLRSAMGARRKRPGRKRRAPARLRAPALNERRALAEIATMILMLDAEKQMGGSLLDRPEWERFFWDARSHIPRAAQLLASIGTGRVDGGTFRGRRATARKPGLVLKRLARWLAPDRPGPCLRGFLDSLGNAVFLRRPKRRPRRKRGS
ncbi:MAG TPA: hypothetical protein VFI25_12290 [Planctomycetota bacterium]|jgi:hypothetical protein|nr:hypothetical protein [Planctomycetota bacterium]